MMSRRLVLVARLTVGYLVASAGVAHAQTVVRVSAEARADAGYSQNPFSVQAGDSGSGFAKIAISPQAKILTERSVITISGLAEYQRYFRHYGDLGSYNAAFDYNGTPSDHLKTHFNLRYDSSIIGRNDQVIGAIDPDLPTPPVTSGTDLSLFGTRDRRKTISANGNVILDLSSRDTVGLGGFYINSRYSRFASLGNNDGYGGSANYSRQVSEHLRLGVQAAIARYDYGGLLGDTMVYSVQPSFSATLGAHWKAEGALGVSFVNSSTTNSSTVFSGNIRLCNTTTRRTFCVNAARAVLPTGISGTQNTSSIDANYSYSISEHSTVFGAVGYTRNGNRLSAGAQAFEFLRGSLGYARDIRKNLRVTISGQYRKIYGGLVERGADYGAQAGIVVRFGDRR